MIYGAHYKYEKKYVEVIAKHTVNDHVEPLVILWPDGKQYSIEAVKKYEYGQCRYTDGGGVVYDVVINGKPKRLYRDSIGWFVEFKTVAI